MIQKKGLGVSNGYSKAKAFVLKEVEVVVPKEYNTDANAEMEKIEKAIEESTTQINALKKEALNKMSEKEAEIFDAHLMMISDDTLKERIKYFVCDEKRKAAWAVEYAKNELVKMFEAIDDEYMRARAADVKDISDRIIRNVLGIKDADSI